MNNRILTIAPYRYNIYELAGNDLQKLYYVDFGKYKLTEKEVARNDLYAILKEVREGRRVSSLSNIAEGASFLSFNVYQKSEPLNFAYSFKEQKPYFINGYFDQNILPKCTVKGIAEDDLFYAIVQPKDLDAFQKATGQNLIDVRFDPEIEDESNPYLITFTLAEGGK